MPDRLYRVFLLFHKLWARASLPEGFYFLRSTRVFLYPLGLAEMKPLPRRSLQSGKKDKEIPKLPTRWRYEPTIRMLSRKSSARPPTPHTPAPSPTSGGWGSLSLAIYTAHRQALSPPTCVLSSFLFRCSGKIQKEQGEKLFN